MLYNQKSIKATMKFVIVALFFLGCDEKGYNQNSSYINRDFKIIEQSKGSILQDKVKADGFYVSELLYKTHNRDSEIFLADEKFCSVHLIDQDFNLERSFSEEDFPYVGQCFHSFDKLRDTTYLFFIQPFKIGQYFNDSLVSVTTIEKEIHVNHFLPARKLPNNRYLLPSAENMMKEPAYYKSNFGIRNLASYMKDQFLFTLLDDEGKIVNEFGKFPDIYLEEGIKYLSPLPYYYSVQSGKIYLSFPISNQVFIYNLEGKLEKSFSIELPGFDFPTVDVSKDSLIPSIDGFSVEQNEENVILYFKTFSLSTPRHTFYKIDLSAETTTIYNPKQFNNVGLLLPNTYNSQLQFLHISWNEEPIKISAINF